MLNPSFMHLNTHIPYTDTFWIDPRSRYGSPFAQTYDF